MTLYVCSTYYHTLIACVKQLTDRREAEILLTEYIPEGSALAERVRESGLFCRTWYIAGVREYAYTGKADLLLRFHRRNAAAIEGSFPPGFRFENYGEVDIFHDDTWMAHYMKDRRLPYRLQEDALDSFKVLSAGPFAHMLQRKSVKASLRRALRVGYQYFGEDGLVSEIEVNDKTGVEIPPKRLVQVPRKPLFDALTAKDVGVLKRIFAKAIPPIEPEKTVLVLTQPLHADGFLSSEDEQIALYRRLSDECLHGWQRVIKAHPRDFTDYANAFPEALILDKNMPSEMLAYVLPCGLGAFTPFPALPNCRRTGGYMKLLDKG